MQELCDKLNSHLPCKSQEDVDTISNMLKEHFDKHPKHKIYWSRKVFIDSGFDDEMCFKMLIKRVDMHFVPSEDKEEHPGIVVRYKYENNK